MKKLLPFFLSAVMFTGCNSGATPEEPPAPAVTTPAVSETTAPAVSTSAKTEMTTSQKDTKPPIHTRETMPPPPVNILIADPIDGIELPIIALD